MIQNIIRLWLTGRLRARHMRMLSCIAECVINVSVRLSVRRGFCLCSKTKWTLDAVALDLPILIDFTFHGFASFMTQENKFTVFGVAGFEPRHTRSSRVMRWCLLVSFCAHCTAKLKLCR